jgi:salicylate hydroxylase
LLAGVFDDGAPVDRGFATARHVHRADLHRVLLDAVLAIDPTAVQTGCRLEAVETDASDRAVAVFEDGRRVTVDVLVGADGTRSVVRRRCFDPSAPRFAGQVAYRCLVPIARAAPFLGGGNAVVSVGGGRIFHRYLVRGRTLVNVIGIARSHAWQEEGWNKAATIAEFASAYVDYHGDVPGLIRAAPPDHLIKWALFDRLPLASWHRGPVVLLGDAAHPILPFLGLGAALAIEDGIVLARALAQVGAEVSRDDALRAYRAARIDRVEDVRSRTELQGEIIQSDEPDASHLSASPSQDPKLFDYNPFTVSLAPTCHA